MCQNKELSRRVFAGREGGIIGKLAEKSSDKAWEIKLMPKYKRPETIQLKKHCKHVILILVIKNVYEGFSTRI